MIGRGHSLGTAAPQTPQPWHVQRGWRIKSGHRADSHLALFDYFFSGSGLATGFSITPAKVPPWSPCCQVPA